MVRSKHGYDRILLAQPGRYLVSERQYAIRRLARQLKRKAKGDTEPAHIVRHATRHMFFFG